MAVGAHRKVVTVLFCDVVGSTALGESVDPEALQELLARYFERMKGIVESHGGSVEKFIGDAVMAVFGVPAAHEDDALRACRAAIEMRVALPELGVAGRIGVDTGEVLTGTEERLATGDAVNVAARLEQAAEAGEVLIGAETLGLVGAAVDAGEMRLLDLKGKSAPVAAYPLLGVREVTERSHASRFVGRERELEHLADAWDRALAGPRCELLTIVGDPGVGKSRLVAEGLAHIDARVVRGRCLSYGDGITYWPVVEVVKQLDALPSDDAARTAIDSLLGNAEPVAATDEIAWAFRKLLEEQAPLVVCFDDIQWGEETFLSLVEATALLSIGAPLLLLCMARPELLDRRPDWPAALRLEPLPEEDAGALVGDAVPERVRDRIVRAAGGNPLFLTEMVALSDADGGEVEVPATLRALLAARLDQLEEPERSVLERGAVEGELFHRGTVQALATDETEVTPRLAALVRRDLVRPDRPMLPREDAYRFRHLLIRDAAYDALPKATRTDLHRRFAEWLEEHGKSLVELDEILGYHLEQAARYAAELGRSDPALAEAASRRLATAGERARWRGDADAAHSLLGRAVRLVQQPDVHLEIAFAMSHVAARDAERLLEQAARRADDAADEAGAALARGLAAQMRLWPGEGSIDEAERLGLEALPLLEREEDYPGLAQMWFALAYGAYNYAHRCEQIVHAAEMARSYETLAGMPHHRSDSLRAMALVYGPRPVGEVLQAFDALDSTVRVDLMRAILLAMSGRIDDARRLVRVSAEHARELGRATQPDLAEIESFSGNHDAAVEQLRFWLDEDRRRGLTGNVGYILALQSRELALAGRYEEAEQGAAQARDHPDNAPGTQALWRQAAALVNASRGEHGDALTLAREALAYAHETDSPLDQGYAYCDLAEVLESAGRRDEAVAAWHEALERYERKGVVPLARRVRERLSVIQESGSGSSGRPGFPANRP